MLSSRWKPPSQLVISRSIYYTMRTWVQGGVPEERCGLLAADSYGRVRRHFAIKNTLQSVSRYQLDPGGQIRAMLWMEKHQCMQMVIYHSHPSGPPRLSPTDLAEHRYQEALYLLWYLNGEVWNTSVFWISEGKPIPIPLIMVKKLEKLTKTT